MSHAYSLTLRQARVVRLAAVLFFLIGLGTAGLAAVSAAVPGISVECGAKGCTAGTDLIALAPRDIRSALTASPSARVTFARHVARPLVRLALATIDVLCDAPFVALMLTVGIALRRLAARRGEDLARALPWLRWASLAAVAMTLVRPLAASLQAMLLYPGTPQGPVWYFEVDFGRMAFDLLLALTAATVVWALDAGSRAERDVTAFV